MFQILFCEQPGIVQVIYFLKIFLNLIRFVTPIILIITISLDFYKNMLTGANEKESIIKKSSNKILACIIVFLVPTMINLLLSILNAASIDTSDYTNDFATCYKEANPTLITQLKEKQAMALSAKEEEERKKNLLNYANVQAKVKEQEEKGKENNVSGSYNGNTTNMNKQNGGVYVQNGVFYYPKGTSGKGCKTPNGSFNNPYGYHNEFWNRLQALKQAAIQAGYNIDYSTQGCRTYSQQVATYEKYRSTPGRAAKPGNSRHGWGIASDVHSFYKNATQKCGSNRSYSNCPGMKWAHENAPKYGLNFPLLNASYKEDWHIEPLNKKTY